MQLDHGILREVELGTELIYDLRRVLTVVDSYLFHVLSVKFDLKYAYRLSSIPWVLEIR